MTTLFDVLLWVGVGLWAILAVMGILNALIVRDLSKIIAPEPREWPVVSYVVPARNEATGIRQAVTSFCQQDYPTFEVIVVNDRSTDDTGAILDEMRGQFDHLTVLEGQDPPPGWLGKPNALETGLSHAKGEWILMADADAIHAPEVLRRAVAYASAQDAGMVVIRPSHLTRGVVEAVLMSGVNFFFFVATPMFLVPLTRSALFSTGSPVFNLIRRDALEACGGFACLKDAVVDDLEIGFRVKQAGYGQAVAYAGTLIAHRMYGGARETVRGFMKTTFPTIKKAPWLLLLYMVCAVVLSFLPYVGFVAGLVAGQLSVPATIALVLMHAILAGMCWRYREPWYTAFANPLREIGWLWIFTRSYVAYHRKGLVWRGRSYPTSH